MASNIASASAVYMEHVDGSLNDVCELFFIMAISTPSSLFEASVYSS